MGIDLLLGSGFNTALFNIDYMGYGELWKMRNGSDEPNKLEYRNGVIVPGEEIGVFGEDWVYDKYLGSGCIGHIILVRDRQGREGVFKCIKKESDLRLIQESIVARRYFGESEGIIDYTQDRVDKGIVSIEYVDGKVVSPHDKEEDITLVQFMEAMVVLRDLFSAILELEQRRCVHNDIKPTNVMLERGSLDVTSTFFGLELPSQILQDMQYCRAKIIDLDMFLTLSEVELRESIYGYFRGTPLYCSPERCKSLTQIGSERHAVGRVVQEMLVGTMPSPARYIKDTIREISRNNTNYSGRQRAVLEGMYKLPGLEPVEKAARNLPGVLEALQAHEVADRLMNTKSVNDLMYEVWEGGNRIAV